MTLTFLVIVIVGEAPTINYTPSHFMPRKHALPLSKPQNPFNRRLCQRFVAMRQVRDHLAAGDVCVTCEDHLDVRIAEARRIMPRSLIHLKAENLVALFQHAHIGAVKHHWRIVIERHTVTKIAGAISNFPNFLYRDRRVLILFLPIQVFSPQTQMIEHDCLLEVSSQQVHLGYMNHQ